MKNKEHIVQILKEGGIILNPTDTIWGLGCDATNEEACQRILELKQRPENKSFIILVDSFLMLEKFIPEFPDVCYDLIELATRPLTIIYPNAKGLAKSVLAEDGSVGIRVTKDPICVELIRALKGPLVSTSANISGQSSPTCFADIDSVIKNGVGAIIEERQDEKSGQPSQIIKIGLDSSIKVLRK